MPSKRHARHFQRYKHENAWTRTRNYHGFVAGLRYHLGHWALDYVPRRRGAPRTPRCRRTSATTGWRGLQATRRSRRWYGYGGAVWCRSDNHSPSSPSWWRWVRVCCTCSANASQHRRIGVSSNERPDQTSVWSDATKRTCRPEFRQRRSLGRPAQFMSLTRSDALHPWWRRTCAHRSTLNVRIADYSSPHSSASTDRMCLPLPPCRL